MGHPGRPGSGAVVGYGLSEDGRIDQRFPPNGEAYGRLPFERHEKVFMLDQGDGGGAYRAYGMIHPLDEKRLGIRHVAGEMNRKVLSPAIRKQMVAGNDA